MKSTDALRTTTRRMGKLFFALTLLLAAIAVGFGGTALFVYHQFGSAHHPAPQPSRGSVADHRTQTRPASSGTDESSQTRRVAAMPSDQPSFTYADNNGGRPSAPAKQSRPATIVPAPLDPPSQRSVVEDASARLNDPESHYIVDARTGRVVGIDGSVGARREEDQERFQQSSTPPRAFAVQTPPPEVRIASPVIEDGQPIYHGAPVNAVSATGSQYLPVRKALPVTSADTDTAPRVFNAAEYLMSDQDRQIRRAHPVVQTGARVVKTVRVFRLPDGSQAVAVD